MVSAHLVGQREKIGKDLSARADCNPTWNVRMARNGPQIIEDQWHEYGMHYLEKEEPKLVEQVRAAVAEMDSIV